MAYVKKNNKEFANCRFLVEKFLKKKQPINWGQEIKIAKRLYADFPEKSFWESVDLGFELNSLAYFLTEAGIQKLTEIHNVSQMEMPEKKNYQLEKTDYAPVKIDKVEKTSILGFIRK